MYSTTNDFNLLDHYTYILLWITTSWELQGYEVAQQQDIFSCF